MAPKIPDYNQRTFEIEALKDSTNYKYKALLYRKKPGEIKTKILKMVGNISTFIIGKDYEYKPIKIMGRKEIVRLANEEKQHYHDLFLKFVEIYTPNTRDHSHGNISKYAGWGLLHHNSEQEIYKNIMNGDALEEDILKIIIHYSWIIAYYKYYVIWIIDKCILYKYGPTLEIHLNGKKILLDEEYRLELMNRRRDKFDPIPIGEKIINFVDFTQW